MFMAYATFHDYYVLKDEIQAKLVAIIIDRWINRGMIP